MSASSPVTQSPPKRKYPMPQTGFVKTGIQEAETARGVEYNTSSATATLSIAFHIYHYNRSKVENFCHRSPISLLSQAPIMSSSTVSKKSSQEAGPSSRSGMVDSREHSTKASASVCLQTILTQRLLLADSSCDSLGRPQSQHLRCPVRRVLRQFQEGNCSRWQLCGT
jgi:hypothetical protein